jgi:hypothetical protein
MKSIRRRCTSAGKVPLYHYTQVSVASLILKSGLRMSSQGQGDGGVYFSTLGPCSYGLGLSENDSKNYEDNIIKDCFGVERLHEFKGKVIYKSMRDRYFFYAYKILLENTCEKLLLVVI